MEINPEIPVDNTEIAYTSKDPVLQTQFILTGLTCFPSKNFRESSCRPPPTFEEGDSYSRFMVRFEEMKQSVSIIRQALQKMPKGPIARKAPLVAPEGEATGRVESSRGEIAYMVMGDNSDKPYRVKIMNGSFRNLIALPFLVRNVHVADMPTIYGSLDYWPVEADR